MTTSCRAAQPSSRSSWTPRGCWPPPLRGHWWAARTCALAFIRMLCCTRSLLLYPTDSALPNEHAYISTEPFKPMADLQPVAQLSEVWLACVSCGYVQQHAILLHRTVALAGSKAGQRHRSWCAGGARVLRRATCILLCRSSWMSWGAARPLTTVWPLLPPHWNTWSGSRAAVHSSLRITQRYTPASPSRCLLHGCHCWGLRRVPANVLPWPVRVALSATITLCVALARVRECCVPASVDSLL